MILPWAAVKQTLQNVASLAVEVFTADNRAGFHRTFMLLLLCGFSGLLFSSLLLLYLLFSLDYEAAVAGGIAGGFGTLLTAALFLSKRVRCMGTLFVISVFVKKSRNLLLTAGTSLVILKHVRNTLENLAVLAGSMVCNLKAKKASITAPFRNYVRMLKWIGDMLKTDLVLGRLNSDLSVSPRLESERFGAKLAEAEQQLNETVRYVQTLATTVSSVTSRLFPAISLLVLTVFIALHMRKYCNDTKYKNRFISCKFVRYDEKQKSEGKASVFPLTPEEEKLHTARATTTDRRAVLKFVRPVASYFVDWVLIMTVDALLFHFVRVITEELSQMKPFHVPLFVSLTEIPTLVGIPFVGENREEDFSYSVSLFEKECLPKPKLLLHSSISPLAVILLILLVMAFYAGKMCQVRLRVCEQFYPSVAEKRVEYLHAQILQRRLKRRKEEQCCSIRSLIMKPDFWCPLLFRPSGEPQSVV